jgi:hypothetical protein
MARAKSLALLAASALASTAPSPAAYDVSWSTPSPPSADHFADGMPLGNGATVALVWANVTAGGVSFYVRHPHAQHTDSQPFTIARVTAALAPNPFASGAYFNQTHHLEDGSVTILAGGADAATYAVALRVYVDANSDTVVVTAAARDGATPYALAVRVDSARPAAPLTYTLPFQCFASTSRPDVAGRLAAAPAPPGAIALRHENCVACGDPDLWGYSVAQQLAGVLPAPLPPSPLDGRVFGVGVFGAAGGAAGAPLVPNADGTALASAAPAAAFTVLVCVRVEDVAAPADWLAGLAAQMARAAAAPEAARRAASDAWWAAFWGRSWVTLPGDASAVAPQYARTRFIQAAQSRNVRVPIKFNGQLYMTAAGARGPLDVDARDWGADNWCAF